MQEGAVKLTTSLFSAMPCEIRMFGFKKCCRFLQGTVRCTNIKKVKCGGLCIYVFFFKFPGAHFCQEMGKLDDI